ncbi:MAG: hypothetical protein IJ809_06275 [Clostridia bacterium]|nr:hypothetical protein [Clostridia bacterium]
MVKVVANNETTKQIRLHTDEFVMIEKSIKKFAKSCNVLRMHDFTIRESGTNRVTAIDIQFKSIKDMDRFVRKIESFDSYRN